jgi:tetratricopeptide (TPR) repeat protein
LQRFSEAGQKLNDAERLCKTSFPSSCADVTRAQARLEMELGHFDRAQRLFDQTLISARARGNRFLEATALLNLSWSALQQEHFDEALDWADKAYRLSTAIDAGYIAQTALGFGVELLSSRRLGKSA